MCITHNISLPPDFLTSAFSALSFSCWSILRSIMKQLFETYHVHSGWVLGIMFHGIISVKTLGEIIPIVVSLNNWCPFPEHWIFFFGGGGLCFCLKLCNRWCFLFWIVIEEAQEQICSPLIAKWTLLWHVFWILIFFKNIFYWSIVDLQCFRFTERWFSYTKHIYYFWNYFPS